MKEFLNTCITLELFTRLSKKHMNWYVSCIEVLVTMCCYAASKTMWQVRSGIILSQRGNPRKMNKISKLIKMLSLKLFQKSI